MIDDVFMPNVHAGINHARTLLINFILSFFNRFQLTRKSFKLKRITAINLIRD